MGHRQTVQTKIWSAIRVSISLDPDQDILSVLIWVQTVAKVICRQQKSLLARKELRAIRVTSASSLSLALASASFLILSISSASFRILSALAFSSSCFLSMAGSSSTISSTSRGMCCFCNNNWVNIRYICFVFSSLIYFIFLLIFSQYHRIVNKYMYYDINIKILLRCCYIYKLLSSIQYEKSPLWFAPCTSVLLFLII